MGEYTIVYGCIELDGDRHTLETAAAVLADPTLASEFPDVELLWTGSPGRYDGEVIPFGGAYANIEHRLGAWMAGFCRVLTRVGAERAHVHIGGWMFGRVGWVLEPDRAPRAVPRQGAAAEIEDSAWVIVETTDAAFPMPMSLDDLRQIGRPPRLQGST